MQEVTIKPRSAFKHYVTVDTPGVEICWNFMTKKKNISFGLFRKAVSNLLVANSSPPSPHRESTASASSPILPLLSTGQPRKSVGAINPSSPLLHQSSSGLKTHVDPELVELLAVAHYESAKLTIKGSYQVSEAGTYVLLFDNTYSMNTSKKLLFHVTVREIEPTTISIPKTVEGWILKKGNRKMQGYSKRWMRIDPTGHLTYSKAPDGENRAVIALPQSAVRLDHDIDAGHILMHLKAQSLADFNMWVGAIQQHAEAKAMRLETFEDSIAKTAAEDADMDVVQRRAENLVIALNKELAKMKDMVDTSRGRVDTKTQWKDFNMLLESISDATSAVLAQAVLLRQEVSAYAQKVKETKDKHATSIRNCELTLKACLADNNRTRKKFGLEAVSISHFSVHESFMHTRDSITRSNSMAADVFFDAEEGADSDDDYAESANSETVDGELDDVDDDVAPYDDDDDDHVVETITTPTASTNAKLLPQKPDEDSTPKTGDFPNKLEQEEFNAAPVIRRKTLPAPAVSMENISILSILRNNVGKDLSTVAMPIALNEPINLLQKLTEELEYSELLEAAAKSDNALDRLVLITAFAVSGYASTVTRAGRKPFNPLLGETYECIREDKGFKFIAEKVSHHPPIMACHAASPYYEFYQDNLVKTKFWGKSMELIPSGTVFVKLKKHNETYSWKKVTTCMRNVFSQTRYLEHYGTMKITSSSGYSSQITFKESGYFVSAKNEVVGSVTSPNGDEELCLSGKWDESLCKFVPSAPNNLEVIWRARPAPPNNAQMYGLTTFAVELNELLPGQEQTLPITDTRFRPDQRMYEEGKVDEAEAEKQRLEQRQREYRKRMEAEGKKWVPRFFEHHEQADNPEGVWEYKGGYWETRRKHEFDNSIDIFGR